MKLPDAWKRYRYRRDSSQSLIASQLREAAITERRFDKAARLAGILYAHGIKAADLTEMNQTVWNQLIQVAGIEEASIPTRALVVRILSYRERWMDEAEAISYVQANMSPLDVFGKPG